MQVDYIWDPTTFRGLSATLAALLWAVTTFQARKLVDCSVVNSSLIICATFRISSSLLKPNTFPFNSSVSQYAKALTRHPKLGSEATIELLVQYQQMLENVAEVYRVERRTYYSPYLHFQTKQMIQNLESWWLSLPRHMRSMCMSAS